MRKKRVLIFSEGFGAGHTQAAYALSYSVRKLSPDVQTRVMELGSFLHPTLAPFILNAYRKTVTAQPRLYGLMYRSQYKKSLNRFTQLALHRLFYAHAAEVIGQLRPDTIICTHPFPSAVISRLKRFGLQVPLCTVITDYDAHGTWISPEVNKYLVSTEDVKRKLVGRGVAPASVEVTGIPVHPAFWQPHNRDELRARFGLNGLPAVLVMGGGWGLMNEQSFLPELLRYREQVQLIVCLGKNERALAALREDERFRHPNVHLLGFTKEIDKWMDVCDLLVTKPGGMTCTEGLAKGIPMLFYEPLPGQEEQNLHYFAQLGLGQPIESAETIDRWLRFLIDNDRNGAPPRRFGADRLPLYNPANCPQAVLELLRQPLSS